MQTSIVLIIDQTGGLKIEAVGFLGTECERATAFLEETLGEVAQKERKAAYFCRANVKEVQRLQR